MGSVVGCTKNICFQKTTKEMSIDILQNNNLENIYTINSTSKNEQTKPALFDTIEINLYYIKKNGKFVLDEEYEREIKNEAKFRWVKLENDGEKRKKK